MEEAFGLHHHLHLHLPAAVGFHDQSAAAPGDDPQGLQVGRRPGYYVVSSYSPAAVSEASVVAGGCGSWATGVPVGGGGVLAAGEEARCSTSVIKAKIASHPLYPRLLEAYIDCQKVGAPPEVASLLEEVLHENDVKRNAVSSFLGADPELDRFMATYCDMLVKYRSDIARSFDEATTFLNSIEVQLGNLCKGSFAPGKKLGDRREALRNDQFWKILSAVKKQQSTRTHRKFPSSSSGRSPGVLKSHCHSFSTEWNVSGEAARSSDEDFSGSEIDVHDSRMPSEDGDLKEKLLRKYGGYLGSLKQEFSKKKKKGKLPKASRQTLLDWWSAHYKWPYPTEADKIALAEATGLHQKQINNWFINQRKRHWKPSENMQLSFMDSLSAPFFLDH